MNLTGKQLVELGIITGPISEVNIAQHGVDLNLMEVFKITGPGFIPASSTEKTTLAARVPVHPIWMEVNGIERSVWDLEPGSYEVSFAQGCTVPKDQRLDLIQRSSVLRNGGFLRSSVFDAGFTTKVIGTVMTFNEPIQIEYGARVAQIVAITSNEVENLYNGQFQGDKQRASK